MFRHAEAQKLARLARWARSRVVNSRQSIVAIVVMALFPVGAWAVSGIRHVRDGRRIRPARLGEQHGCAQCCPVVAEVIILSGQECPSRPPSFLERCSGLTPATRSYVTSLVFAVLRSGVAGLEQDTSRTSARKARVVRQRCLRSRQPIFAPIYFVPSGSRNVRRTISARIRGVRAPGAVLANSEAGGHRSRRVRIRLQTSRGLGSRRLLAQRIAAH